MMDSYDDGQGEDAMVDRSVCPLSLYLSIFCLTLLAMRVSLFLCNERVSRYGAEMALYTAGAYVV